MSELTKEHFDQEMEKFSTRMSAVESKVSEVNQVVLKIDKRDKEDSGAFAKDILQLQKKVKHLELKQV